MRQRPDPPGEAEKLEIREKQESFFRHYNGVPGRSLSDVPVFNCGWCEGRGTEPVEGFLAALTGQLRPCFACHGTGLGCNHATHYSDEWDERGLPTTA
jgi:hypothetical protein